MIFIKDDSFLSLALITVKLHLQEKVSRPNVLSIDIISAVKVTVVQLSGALPLINLQSREKVLINLSEHVQTMYYNAYFYVKSKSLKHKND